MSTTQESATEGRVDGPDPDGNGWVLQEITVRLPGR